MATLHFTKDIHILIILDFQAVRANIYASLMKSTLKREPSPVSS